MSEETRSDTYAELASVGPYGVRPGHALITMVEPHPGHEHAYNRWYEDDHYYAGAMAMPWMFAGRRWVATRELQELRRPEKSAVARPVTAGCYLSTYWITEGRYDEHMKWTVGINKRLNHDGRVHQERTHVFTSFQDHEATVYRDGAAGPRDVHALDHPYAGLVLQVVDTENPDRRAALLDRLVTRDLPHRLAGSPAAMVTIFRPTPLPGDRMTYVKQVEGVDTRLTLLWFLDQDPRTCWTHHFADLEWLGDGDGDGDEGAGEGRGAGTDRGAGVRVELVAPFIPTVPGTDRYVDELR
ncbi:hypothetical protein ACFT8P_09275 [Streptomyces sp. NPDC057101]|uniref:hypothetical protein n=1 Tax=Streptomyces sp. NPDC057101 TaxID=3346020 RepID=UPI00363ECAD9